MGYGAFLERLRLYAGYVWHAERVLRTLDRGQVHTLREGDVGEAHLVHGGAHPYPSIPILITHSSLVLGTLQEEVWPALRVAHAQLPPDESRWKTVIPVVADLKQRAKQLGLWNLFLSKAHYPKFGVPLTNLEVSIELGCACILG